MKPSLLPLVLALWLLAVLPARAQYDVRSVAALGLSGGGPAYVQDNAALFFNPANLVLGTRGRVVLTLGRMGAHAGGDLLQFGPYNRAFTQGRRLTDADVDAVLDEWFGPDGSAVLRSAGGFASAVPVALSYRNGRWGVGFALRVRSLHQAGVGRGLFDLVLRGTEEDRTLPFDARLRSLSTADLAFAYSLRLPGRRLALGVAPRLVLGTHYARTDLASTLRVTDGALDHTFAYTARVAGAASRSLVDRVDLFGTRALAGAPAFASPFASIAGTGFGLDAGVTYLPTDRLTLSASLTDLGAVTWRHEAETITPAQTSFHLDDLALDLDRLDGDFDGDLGAYLEHVADSLGEAVYGDLVKAPGAFTTPLPAALHTGAAWRPAGGRTTLAAGVSFALNDAAGNLSRAPLLSVGGEYRLGGRLAVPLRGGLSAGGGGALGLSFGLGLHTRHYDLDLGLSATPYSATLGRGARYAVGFTAATLRF